MLYWVFYQGRSRAKLIIVFIWIYGQYIWAGPSEGENKCCSVCKIVLKLHCFLTRLSCGSLSLLFLNNVISLLTFLAHSPLFPTFDLRVLFCIFTLLLFETMCVRSIERDKENMWSYKSMLHVMHACMLFTVFCHEWSFKVSEGVCLCKSDVQCVTAPIPDFYSWLNTLIEFYFKLGYLAALT